MKMRPHLTSWHRLDNAANVFPLISHKTFSNVFRLAAQMTEPVQPELLQMALDITLPAFGNFNFRIRRGFFWFYFEPTDSKLIVQEEYLRPCSYIDTKSKHHHLLRIFYYKNRISLEVFHAITDGTGASNFLKALLVNYLKLTQSEVLPDNPLRLRVHSELEDSYKKYYQKMPHDKGRLPHALRLKGKLLPINTIGIIHGYVDLQEILDHCKSVGVTLTVYLTSVYLWSIYTVSHVDGVLKKPLHLAVPVNLRRFFESNTNMNFFSFITIAMKASSTPLSFETLLESVDEQFKRQVTKENMLKNISKDVELKLNLITRAFPLPLKNILVKLVHIASVQSYTSTLSNVGKVEMPEKWADYIDHFELLMNTSGMDPMKCAICAYKNKLVVTLSSQLEEPRIQSEFFRKLSSDGLNVSVESNGAYYEIL